VKGVEKRPEKNETKGATKQYLRRARQFIYGKQNFHKGAFGIVPKELDGFETSSDIPAFDVAENCLPEWIYYFFKAKNRYLELEKLASGVGSKRVSPKKVFEIKIPLPRVEDQNRIITKIKNFEKKGDRIFDHNIFQKSHLILLRQQILQDAISGKLTANWRAKNPDTKPASKLLEQIKIEKEKLIAQKKIKKGKKLPPISENEIPFELPKGWEWSRVMDFSSRYVDCPHDTPKYKEAGFPCLRAPDVTESGLLLETVRYVDEKEYEKRIRRLQPEKNDLVYIREGGRLGVAGLINTDQPVCLGQRVMMLRFHCEDSAKFALIFFNAPKTYKEIVGKTIGSASPHVNVRDIIAHAIPIPPRAEQRAIVAKVEQLMGYVSQLEEKIAQNANNVETLMQAFLGEVFSK